MQRSAENGLIEVLSGTDRTSAVDWMLCNVHVSEGVHRVRIPGRERSLYENGIFVPSDVWHPISVSEAAEHAAMEGTPSRNPIRVLPGRPELTKLLATLDLRHALKPTDWHAAATSIELNSLQLEVGKELRRYGLCAARFVVQVRRPGLPSTTYDDAARTLIGLHVDNYDHHALTERDEAGPRLLLNIGREARSFVCLPKTLKQLFLELEVPFTDEGLARYQYTYRLVHDYLDRFPRTKIYRFRLEPGFGIIAPVQNMTHDGYTVGMNSVDIVLSAPLDAA